VIYNGILAPETMELEKETYAVADKINCCIVAAFYSKDIKGYQYLLPAIAKLKSEGVPVVLHICGGGDYFEYYVNLAKELDIEDSVIFYGNCSKAKVYSIVSQMDFNISASLFECSGVSVEEALLLGKPMLVTRSGGANSLVTEDVAIVVDKGSTDALVDGIRQMADRLPQFDSKKIRAYAEENFEIDHVSRQYMALYEEISHDR
jgi:glycosyltransferase involved in cell wall biosynthesis